MEISLTKNLKV